MDARLGISVDPDVDRLCFVCEDGSFFGEEYTLVAVADHVLAPHARAHGEQLEQHPGPARGERPSWLHLHGFGRGRSERRRPNAQATEAILGGEGNGGVIYPTSHAGRDALVGIGLFLTHLVSKGTRRAVRFATPTPISTWSRTK